MPLPTANWGYCDPGDPMPEYHPTDNDAFLAVQIENGEVPLSIPAITHVCMSCQKVGPFEAIMCPFCGIHHPTMRF